MRTMYDAVTAANIPSDAKMVAGYIDKIKLEPWKAADWARFPHAVKVEIVKKASTNAGHVLDVEIGDATPGEAPGWVRMRRVAGADPTIYCNAATWPAVRSAFAAAGVAEPHYWVARYDGDPTIPAGAVAKQYRGDVKPGYDVSSVQNYWPGVDPAPTPIDLTEEEDMSVKLEAKFDPNGAPVKHYDEIPVNGKKSLFLATSYGHKVAITGITAVFNTNSVPQTAQVKGALTLDPDRPGPIVLPDNVRHVVVEYIAEHDFRGWAA